VGDFNAERRKPSAEELAQYLRESSNWGRWGEDDELGALNLITPQKRIEAAAAVRSGRVVSLGRNVPKEPGAGNPRPVFHAM
jgi:hypothetical protein